MMDNSNLGGRPPMYSNVEEIQAKIDEYFLTGLRKKTVIIGKGENATTIEVEVPTITGLALFLGFESRTSFYDYEKREGFMYTIKRARLFIEREYEEMLQFGNTVGAIFALKNMGWMDTQKIETTNLNKNIDLTPQQIKDISDKLENDI